MFSESLFSQAHHRACSGAAKRFLPDRLPHFVDIHSIAGMIALRLIGRDWPEPEKSPGAAAAPPARKPWLITE